MRSSLGSIQQLENGYYKVTATVGIDPKTGKQKRRSKRVHGSKREAENALAKLLTSNSFSDENKTITSLIDDYLASKKETIRNATYLDYVSLCQPIYNSTFASCAVKDISKREREVRRWLNGFDKEWTRRTEYKMLRQILNFARKRHMLEVSPLDFIEPPAPPRKEIKTVNTSTLPQYLNAVKDTDIEAGVLIMLYMGLRRSEACARKWEDLDFDNSTLEIYSSIRLLKGGGVEIGKTKTEKSTRLNYIPAPCLDRLKEIREKRKDEVWLCELRGEPMRPDVFSKKWKKILRGAGLEEVVVKNLRHSCGTMLIREMGASIADVAELLGHSETRTTEKYYLQQSDESKKRVANLWKKSESED